MSNTFDDMKKQSSLPVSKATASAKKVCIFASNCLCNASPEQENAHPKSQIHNCRKIDLTGQRKKRVRFKLPKQMPQNTCNWEQSQAIGIAQDQFENTFTKPLTETCEAAVAELKELAAKGDSKAQYDLAECYLEGKGVPFLPLKAIHYYQLAAQQGNIFALVALGHMYESAIGIEQSPEKAFYYYQQAVNLDHHNSSAIASLASCYENGFGVEKDHKKAFEYYVQAEENSLSDGECYIAHCYLEGIGVPKSKEKAFQHAQKYIKRLEEESNQGNAHSQAVLGSCYWYGEYVERSLEHAVYYYKLAADQNHPLGLILLATCYITGNGVPTSQEKAIDCYQRASDLGDLRARFLLAKVLFSADQSKRAVELFKGLVQSSHTLRHRMLSHFYLGECYREGKGIQKSLTNALYHYRQAAELGNADAQTALERLTQDVSG